MKLWFLAVIVAAAVSGCTTGSPEPDSQHQAVEYITFNAHNVTFDYPKDWYIEELNYSTKSVYVYSAKDKSNPWSIFGTSIRIEAGSFDDLPTVEDLLRADTSLANLTGRLISSGITNGIATLEYERGGGGLFETIIVKEVIKPCNGKLLRVTFEMPVNEVSASSSIRDHVLESARCT